MDFEPGDVVRDAYGNLWCKAATGPGFRLVHVFATGARLLDGFIVIPSAAGQLLTGPENLPGPLYPVARMGAAVDVSGAWSPPPSGTTSALRAEPLPYTIARFRVLTWAASGWLEVSRTPDLNRVWRSLGGPLDDEYRRVASDLANYSLIGFTGKGLFGVYAGQAHATTLGTETLALWRKRRKAYQD